MSHHETERAGALAALAGRLHFEALLAELHQRAELLEAERQSATAAAEPATGENGENGQNDSTAQAA